MQRLRISILYVKTMLSFILARDDFRSYIRDRRVCGLMKSDKYLNISFFITSFTVVGLSFFPINDWFVLLRYIYFQDKNLSYIFIEHLGLNDKLMQFALEFLSPGMSSINYLVNKMTGGIDYNSISRFFIKNGQYELASFILESEQELGVFKKLDCIINFTILPFSVLFIGNLLYKIWMPTDSSLDSSNRFLRYLIGTVAVLGAVSSLIVRILLMYVDTGKVLNYISGSFLLEIESNGLSQFFYGSYISMIASMIIFFSCARCAKNILGINHLRFFAVFCSWMIWCCILSFSIWLLCAEISAKICSVYGQEVALSCKIPIYFRAKYQI